MFCSQCGAANPDNGKFCTTCGASLAGRVPAGNQQPAGAAPARTPGPAVQQSQPVMQQTRLMGDNNTGIGEVFVIPPENLDLIKKYSSTETNYSVVLALFTYVGLSAISLVGVLPYILFLLFQIPSCRFFWIMNGAIKKAKKAKTSEEHETQMRKAAEVFPKMKSWFAIGILIWFLALITFIILFG